VLRDQVQVFANRLPFRIGVQHEDAMFVEDVNPGPAPIGDVWAYRRIVGVVAAEISETLVKLGFVQCLVATNLSQ
jgi:hypothetical protein